MSKWHTGEACSEPFTIGIKDVTEKRIHANVSFPPLIIRLYHGHNDETGILILKYSQLLVGSKFFFSLFFKLIF